MSLLMIYKLTMGNVLQIIYKNYSEKDKLSGKLQLLLIKIQLQLC